MYSSLILKMEKAHRYARERQRMHVDALQVTFHGDVMDHIVRMDGDRLSCDCDFYGSYETCSHTMALEKVLEGMVPARALPV